jgi:hypothetical protein
VLQLSLGQEPTGSSSSSTPPRIGFGSSWQVLTVVIVSRLRHWDAGLQVVLLSLQQEASSISPWVEPSWQLRFVADRASRSQH